MEIKDLQVIENNQKDFLQEIDNEIKKSPVIRAMSGGQIGLGVLQMNVLGTGDFPTIDSKYWQAKLELAVRLDGLKQEHYQYIKLKAELELLNLHKNSLSNKIKIIFSKLAKIKQNILDSEIEQKNVAINNLLTAVKDKMREIKWFHQYMTELKPHCKFESSEQAWEEWTKIRIEQSEKDKQIEKKLIKVMTEALGQELERTRLINSQLLLNAKENERKEALLKMQQQAENLKK